MYYLVRVLVDKDRFMCRGKAELKKSEFYDHYEARFAYMFIDVTETDLSIKKTVQCVYQ